MRFANNEENDWMDSGPTVFRINFISLPFLLVIKLKN
jgi:hypothetical protein